MDAEQIIDAIKHSSGSDVDIDRHSHNSFMVHTGYTYPDGDELFIILAEEGGNWVFTDWGHTMMWLSYGDFTLTATRRSILECTLNYNGVTMTEGVLSIKCPDDAKDIGYALRAIIKTELQMADLLFLDRDAVKSTFIEDLKSTFLNSELSDRCRFDVKVSGNDGMEYHADVFIDSESPILVFGIHSAIQCSRSTVAMLSLGMSERRYLSIAVFDKDCRIPKNDMDKAVNASVKTAYGAQGALEGARMLLSGH